MCSQASSFSQLQPRCKALKHAPHEQKAHCLAGLYPLPSLVTSLFPLSQSPEFGGKLVGKDLDFTYL